MDGAENKPMIRIHLDQQVTIDAVSGSEEVEDATVMTEITGFDVEDDLYVLRGALSFTGFLRLEDSSDTEEELPDAFDDRDVFATGEDVAEAQVMPFHHSLPFVLQVPVAAQLAHQRESGVLNVNPKIGQWNVHVLGEQTVHLRCELIIQGLSGTEGYVFRCGSQEEGVNASKLDHLLDQEESRSFLPPEPQAEEFEPPFEPAWQVEEGANFAARSEAEAEANEASDDDWLIESPVHDLDDAPHAFETFDTYREESAFAFQTEADAEDGQEEEEILFTPDPSFVFPMPDPGTEWARQLEAADRAFGESLPERSPYFLGAKEYTMAYDEPAPEYQPDAIVAEETPALPEEPAVPAMAVQESMPEPYMEVQDEDGFVLEEREETEMLFEAVNEAVFVEEAAEAPVAQVADAVHEEFAAEVAQEERVVEEAAHDEAHAAQEDHATEPLAVAAHEDRKAAAEADAAPEDHVAEPIAEAAHEEREVEAEEDFALEDHALEPAAEADDVQEDRPAEAEAAEAASEADAVQAEYVFEDEVEASEEAVPVDAAPQVVEQPFVKPTGPKLSVGSKHVTMTTDEPIKLSALLGDSRSVLGDVLRESAAQALEALQESGHMQESGSMEDAAQLIRESLAQFNNSTEAGDAAYESASVFTSKHGHHKNADPHSIWGDLLMNEREGKVTMKFRIVQEEDNLTDLAERYNTSINDLVRANNLMRQEVDAGQVLYIPTRRR